MPKPIRIDPARVYAQTARGKQGARWYWRAVVHRGGKQRTIWTGWATRAEATRAVAALVADLDARPAQQADEARDLGDVLDWWLGAQMQRADLQPQTVDGQRAAARHALRLAGDTPVNRVTVRTLERVRDLALREGLAPSTVHGRIIRVIRQAWLWAQEEGLVDPRPLGHLRARRNDADRVVPGHTPPMREVWQVIDTMRDGYPVTTTRHTRSEHTATHREPRWVVDVLTIMAGTGLRVGEVGQLRWADVRGDALHVQPGKTGRGRVVYLPPWLVEHFAAMPREAMRVIDRSPRTVRQAVGLALRRFPWAHFGLERWTSHALRRAAVDALYRAGVDPATAASHLGHSPATALRHYRRASEDDLRRAVRAAGIGGRGQAVPLRVADEG